MSGPHEATPLDGPAIGEDADVAAWHQVLHGAALRDVVAERLEQVTTHGFTPDHDLHHHPHELAQAGDAYAAAAIDMLEGGFAALRSEHANALAWPWERDMFRPTDPRAALVKAAALIWAAIDRLDNAPADYAPEAK